MEELIEKIKNAKTVKKEMEEMMGKDYSDGYQKALEDILEIITNEIDRVREDESEKVLRIKGTQEEKDKLKKEILDEFEEKHSYRESINREVHLDFLNHVIDRVRAVRDEEVEEIPVMKGTNEALDNITIRKEEECTCRIEYEDRMPITVMCAKHKQEEEERLRKEYSPNEESQIGVSKVETKMEEIVLDNRDENDHEGIQELQIELNELVELVEEEFSLNEESPYYSWFIKIANKKIEISINKNKEDKLGLELDDLIELVEAMEQEKLKANCTSKEEYDRELRDLRKVLEVEKREIRQNETSEYNNYLLQRFNDEVPPKITAEEVRDYLIKFNKEYYRK